MPFMPGKARCNSPGGTPLGPGFTFLAGRLAGTGHETGVLGLLVF